MDAELVVEDELAESVLRRAVAVANPTLGIHAVRITNGFGQIKKQLSAFNSLANVRPVIVLTDQDQAECAPSLIGAWFGAMQRSPRLTFRVATRETESWVMADRQAFAALLGIQINQVPAYPDQLDDPKQTLLALAAMTPHRGIRKALLPVGVTAKIGPGYNDILTSFVYDKWSASRARANSSSLDRAMTRIRII